MTKLEILKAGRKKIEDFDNWCVGRYQDPERGRFCAVGALQTVEPNRGSRISAVQALDRAAESEFGAGNIMALNDGLSGRRRDRRRHKKVLEAFDIAIEETK